MKKTKVRNLILFTSSFAMLGVGFTIQASNESSYKNAQQIERYIESYNGDEISIAAHRGYSSLAVENTVDAIELASSAPYVDYIELDIRLTSDNQFVISHNDTVTDTNGKDVKISKTSSDELLDKTFVYDKSDLLNYASNLFNYQDGYLINKRNIMLDKNIYEIASLNEALEASHNKPLLIDIKFSDGNYKEVAKEIHRIFSDKDTSNIIFQSLDVEGLRYLRKKEPHFNYLALIRNSSYLKYIDEFENIGVEMSLLPRKEVLNAIKNPDRIVAIWTINSMFEAQYCKSLLDEYYDDVIYITNYPDVTTYTINNQKNDNIKSKKRVLNKKS